MEELVNKVVQTIRNEGVVSLNKKIYSYLKTKKIEKQARNDQVFRDVLFIDGCGAAVPHPARYRITHQREQLAYYGISSNEIFFRHLSIEMVRLYRVFIFFRCPYSSMIGEFIQTAKKLNKAVLFDIDDLVIDTKYTDMIPYLDTMDQQTRKQYNADVMAMGNTLKHCDAAITTTKCLQKELLKYVPNVFVNRNTASEKMEELSEIALKNKQEKKTVDLGYFSGSITHNDDFNMILPILVDVLGDYGHVKLHVVGELDLPEELRDYHEQVVVHPFVDWKKLPELIAQVDINLAPLTRSLFNEAKSENKWVEAALVRVPTVASNFGAFKECISDGVTGLLCDELEDWKDAIVNLIEYPELRSQIANNAYNYCKENCLSYKTGYKLAGFVKTYFQKNMLFVLPSLEISGGVMVALQHACILQEAGYDIALASMNPSALWYEKDGKKIPVLMMNRGMIQGEWDAGVATMWTTLPLVLENYRIKKKYYLVQNYETEFYRAGEVLRLQANATYAAGEMVKYKTISRWCQEWLKSGFGQNAEYAPNGIEFDRFSYDNKERRFDGKIKILIEGDCSSYYKNVDESFEIAEQLDRGQFEIWYMSYNAEPKDWYVVDRFFHKIPYSDVANIYRQCDILLKTSILESFSYPPLEMMATGGFVVALPNGGNKEYLIDGYNCLLYEQGNIGDAVNKIHTLCSDAELRHRLYSGGIETAKKRDWNKIKKEIIDLYREEKIYGADRVFEPKTF